METSDLFLCRMIIKIIPDSRLGMFVSCVHFTCSVWLCGISIRYSNQGQMDGIDGDTGRDCQMLFECFTCNAINQDF